VADEATENVTVGKERGTESGGNGATHTHTHTHTHTRTTESLPAQLLDTQPLIRIWLSHVR